MRHAIFILIGCLSLNAWAHVLPRAIIVNKLTVDAHHRASVEVDFKNNDTMAVSVDDFMSSEPGGMWQPVRGHVYLKKKGTSHTLKTVSLPRSCLRSVHAGHVLRVYGLADAKGIHHVHCTLFKVNVDLLSH